MVSNAGSALGEAIGKLFETAIVEGLKDVVEARGCTITAARLRNGTGNVYQIDGVIFNNNNQPLIIIDPKYIRYTKHNRDKGSWLCVAHYNLRKTFPTIRKSVAVLAGRWSAPSKELIRSFGVQILEVPFDAMCNTLAKYGINFNWEEKDRAGSRRAWEDFVTLGEGNHHDIARDLTQEIMGPLQQGIAEELDTDLTKIPQRVAGVEVLLKTDRNEMLLTTFPTVAEALKALANLVSDKPDISAFTGTPAI